MNKKGPIYTFNCTYIIYIYVCSGDDGVGVSSGSTRKKIHPETLAGGGGGVCRGWWRTGRRED